VESLFLMKEAMCRVLNYLQWQGINSPQIRPSHLPPGKRWDFSTFSTSYAPSHAISSPSFLRGANLKESSSESAKRASINHHDWLLGRQRLKKSAAEPEESCHPSTWRSSWPGSGYLGFRRVGASEAHPELHGSMLQSSSSLLWVFWRR